MVEFYPVIFGASVLTILSVLEILFIRLLNRRWWKYRLIRRGSIILPLVGLGGIAIWTAGIFALKKTIMIIGATLAALDLVLLLALLLSLPVSGIFNLIIDFLEYRRRRKQGRAKADISRDEVPSPDRRHFLKGAAAIVPVAALTSASSGIAHAFTDCRVYEKEIALPNLPENLVGFRILHLSDIHIGYYTWLEDVEELLERAREFKPDIILATGDLSDRVDVYGDLLNLLDQFKAPLGVFACVGNHEYFRGFDRIRRIFDLSPVTFLLNQGVNLKVGGSSVFIGGADDPRRMHSATAEFFHKTLESTLQERDVSDCTIVMSHRPTAFDLADQYDIDLILAGHTHGGQIGTGKRSAFEAMYPNAYLWGLYEKGPHRLYTTSGVGHWFPFRLGCPAEAPILKLVRS